MRSISHGFNKPKSSSRTILAAVDFAKAFVSARHIALFHKVILGTVAFPFACFHRLNFFTQTGAFAWCFKIKQVALFETVEVLSKNSYLAVFIALFSSAISQHLSLPSPISCSLCADDWPSGLSPLDRCCGGCYIRRSNLTGALAYKLASSSQFEQM